MTTVYLLWHNGPRFDEHGDDADSKLLGVFGSEAAAQAWIDDASNLPGFRDATDRFMIDPHELEKRHWTDGFDTVRGPVNW